MIGLALALAALPVPDSRDVRFYAFPGADSCGDWTLNRENRGRRTQALEGWVLGYVSGYNFYRDPTGDVAPDVTAIALLAWVDGYCKANPLDNLAEVSLKLIDELTHRQG